MNTSMFIKINRQSGVVSLIVVAVLAIVLGLVAIGFSQLTNRELKQASDRELSAQAYYAAQAGINDAIAYLENGGADFPGCATPGAPYFTAQLNSTVKYTCVSVHRTGLANLYKSPLSAGQSVTYKLDNNAVNNMARLYFGWANFGSTNTGTALSATTGSLPQENLATSQKTGVLRVSIYAVPNGANCAGNDCLVLAQSSRTYFMYPNGPITAPPGSVDFGSGSYNVSPPSPLGPTGTNGWFVRGNCKNGNSNPVPSNPQAPAMFCNTFIQGLNTSTTTYYVRLTALYNDLSVSLQATDSSGNAKSINGLQGVIDVTGQGTDVLQRVRATVDLNKDYLTPDYALQSMETICKGFQVEVSAPNTYKPKSATNVLTDPACSLPTVSNGTGSGPQQGPH